jgi:signal transduction histidine kinase
MTHRLGRYGFAALMVLVGTAGLAFLDRVFPIERAPFFLFTPSVFIAAVLGGLGPGVFATFLGSLAVEMLLISSHDHGGSPEVLRLAVFVVNGIGISVLAESLRDARALAERRAQVANTRADELATARAAAEQNAREAERRAAELDALFDVSPMGIARANDATCENVTVNQSLAQRLGITTSTNASMTAPPEVRPPLRIAAADGSVLALDDLPLQTAARTRRPVLGAEFSVVRQDGRSVVLEAHALPLLDERGDVRGALGVFTDVTENRRAADEQRFLVEATRLLGGSLEYEETLRRVVALAVPRMADWAVIDMTDARGHVRRLASVHHDAAREAMLDLEAAPTGPPGGQAPLTLIAAAAKPIVVSQVSDESLRALGASEAQIERSRRLGVASSLAVPLRLQGEVVGAFAWMRGGDRAPFDERDLALAEEIGRRASLAVEHARLYREAQSANRMKDEFVATLSHELRTPLNALLGWTELLRSGRLSPERQREAIDAVHRTATAQAQLTNDLVDVSRAVSGKFHLAPREVEIGALVQAATDTFRLAAESKRLWLRCHVADDLPRVVVDPDRVQQIAYNLVGNAVKFTSTGGVDVEALNDSGWVRLVVRDTGIGIDPTFLPYVFDRFRQADGTVTREFGGLGLGLSIVRALTELHGGTVTAESAGPGRGATFIVRLPLSPPATRRGVDVAVSQPA